MKINIRHEIDDDFVKLALAVFLQNRPTIPADIAEEKFLEWLTENIQVRGSDAHSFFNGRWFSSYKQEAEQLFNDWGLNEK